MVAAAGVLALFVVALVGAFVLVPLARHSRQLRREREHAQREAAEAKRECEHVWAPWEFIHTTRLFKGDSSELPIGFAYTQRRNCLTRGYTEMKQQELKH